MCRPRMDRFRRLPLTANTLSVIKGGTGSGTVMGAGINCGADCVETAAAGTMFTLTATPSIDSSFAGWSGGCSGTGNCNVTLNSSTAVTAMFDKLPEAFLPNCQFPAGFTNQPGRNCRLVIGNGSSAHRHMQPKVRCHGTCRSARAGQHQQGALQHYRKLPGWHHQLLLQGLQRSSMDCFRLIGATQQNIGGTCTNIGGFWRVRRRIDLTWSRFLWQRAPIHLPGPMEKDDTGIGGSDAAWIDDLVLPPLAPV